MSTARSMRSASSDSRSLFVTERSFVVPAEHARELHRQRRAAIVAATRVEPRRAHDADRVDALVVPEAARPRTRRPRRPRSTARRTARSSACDRRPARGAWRSPRRGCRRARAARSRHRARRGRTGTSGARRAWPGRGSPPGSRPRADPRARRARRDDPRRLNALLLPAIWAAGKSQATGITWPRRGAALADTGDMPRLTSLTAILLATLAALPACTDEADIEDGADDAFPSGKADGGFDEGSPEALGVLALVNDSTTTAASLKAGAHITARVAGNIVNHRLGADKAASTADDDLYDTLHELDAIPYVGPKTLDALVAMATDKGLVHAGPKISVIFSPQPAAMSHTAKIAQLIAGAQHSVDIAIYSYSDAGIAQALTDAVKRGVTVRFLFDTASTDHNIKDDAGARELEVGPHRGDRRRRPLRQPGAPPQVHRRRRPARRRQGRARREDRDGQRELVADRREQLRREHDVHRGQRRAVRRVSARVRHPVAGLARLRRSGARSRASRPRTSRPRWSPTTPASRRSSRRRTSRRAAATVRPGASTRAS